jgi:hypothetical protein
MTTTGKRLHRLGACVLIALLAGCSHHHSKLKTTGCSSAMPMNNMGWSLGSGAYEAQVVQDMLVVQASGENPAVNYEEKLALQMPGIFPPKFVLYMRKSQGAGAQSLTEFKVCTKYRLSPSQHLDSVMVKDAKGDHTVPIELAAK